MSDIENTQEENTNNKPYTSNDIKPVGLRIGGIDGGETIIVEADGDTPIINVE